MALSIFYTFVYNFSSYWTCYFGSPMINNFQRQLIPRMCNVLAILSSIFLIMLHALLSERVCNVIEALRVEYVLASNLCLDLIRKEIIEPGKFSQTLNISVLVLSTCSFNVEAVICTFWYRNLLRKVVRYDAVLLVALLGIIV